MTQLSLKKGCLSGSTLKIIANRIFLFIMYFTRSQKRAVFLTRPKNYISASPLLANPFKNWKTI